MPQPRSVRQGQTFTVTLAGNPSTGYCWEWDQKGSSDNLEFVSSKFIPDPIPVDDQDIPATGTGGRYQFTFVARKTGLAELHFVYRRPWEKTALREHLETAIVTGCFPSTQLAV